MAIKREQWEEFAKSIYERYFREEDKRLKGMKGVVLSKDEFASEVAQLFGGYSTWRVNEMKKAGDLYGFLFRYDDNHYVISYPAITAGAETGQRRAPLGGAGKKRS